MELGREDDEQVILFVGEELGTPYPIPYSPPPTHICRICHEEEEQSCCSMESPCACSGSLRFAHRECVQRWCDEKGSTVCEICLERYEPSYTVAPQRPVVDVGVTNRRSTEVPGQEHDQPPEVELVVHRPSSSNNETSNANSSSVPMKGTIYCQSIYMILATLLLIRHLISVLALGAQFHASTLFMVFVLRASGIIIPIFVIMKATIMVIRSFKSKQ